MLNLEKEMTDFLKANKKRYHRFMVAILEKYKSIGNIGGTIFIENLNEEERDFLAKIDSKYITANQAKITVKKLLSRFKNTKFSEVDFVEVLKLYFKDEIKTNKEVKDEKERQKQEYFEEILASFKDTRACIWLENAINNKSYGYHILLRQYELDYKNLETIIRNVLNAVNFLVDNKAKKRLAIFASEITKNPHYFDDDKIAGALLIYALAFLSKISIPETSEEKNELLYSYGILKDEISNYTICANVHAYTLNGEHEGVRNFYERAEPLQLNLWNLSNIESIKCNGDVLFVFENPSVFSEVLLRTEDKKPSLVCTSGQIKLASLVFLDKVAQNVDKIYYSGDIDPEGISIAYKLKKRYKEKLIYWRFDVSSYHKSKSNIKFDDRRKKQLEAIDDEDLRQLIDEVLKYECCGYQEVLIEDYIKDINSTIDKKHF